MSTQDEPISPTEMGFPPWRGEYHEASDPDGGCPVAPGKMEEYMAGNHVHLCTNEPPTEFADFKLLEKFCFSERRFWVWSCSDGYGRTWDIVVGSGATPFHGQTGKELWMHAERSEIQQNPRALIARDYPEHNHELGKAN